MSGFNFGSGSTNTGGGFSFGGTASTPAAAGTGGFTLGGGLGGAASTTTTSSLGLGVSLFAQKPTGGFSFNTPASGAPAASTAPTMGFSMAFNKPSASAQPFSLTAASSAPSGAGLTLGSVLTSTAPQQGATGFALNLGGVAASTAPSTGLSLGSSMFSNMNPTGLAQTTLGSGGLTLGSLVSTSTAISTAPSLGLGGVDFSTSSEKKSDKSLGASPQDSKALKDENLPPVICQDVDHFQKFVKEQKQVHEEISRMSFKAMLKVQDDIKSLKQLLSVSASGLQRNALAIGHLKMEAALELKNADIALRTQKTPPGLQHENTAPYDYFRCLVDQFEVQLQQYRQQIEELENHLSTQGSGSHITPQDLSLAMQKLYQTFVCLAAQLQSVHENVKILKQQYLGYRRAFLEDSTDVFESKRAASKKWKSATRITIGPAPFGSVPNAAAVAMAATLSQQQPGPVFGGGPGFGGVATGGSFGFSSASKASGGSLSAGFGSSSSSGFNFSNPGLNASAGLTFGVSNPTATGFGTGGPLLQLKKPPVGNKRGKR
ncbi:nucleoporin p58/p45 isoform X2 [Salmo salar]|uniref:Nucleoporin p58/p45 isoform X2 n=1 Tax=Salmo salar TaxID=8030 RepID=A0A1S3QAZ3_SALSA|nr:nucleoporin p58/p45 isoform X2 [Salmo salar]|eukprot:XP_014037158.1 PREDICTED: nucleoporin p58/p45-like isoform X2 [Salmo salar]